jgi:hypothetical protein
MWCVGALCTLFFFFNRAFSSEIRGNCVGERTKCGGLTISFLPCVPLRSSTMTSFFFSDTKVTLH